MRADGAGLRRLTQQQGVVGSPTWSPDGKQLVFYETGLDGLGKITYSRSTAARHDPDCHDCSGD